MNILEIDESAIAELKTVEQETGEPLIRILVDLYLVEAPKQLHEMGHRLEVDDLATAGRIAHSLKSTSGSLGLKGMMLAVAEIDLAVKTQTADRNKLILLHHKIQQGYPEIQIFLEKLAGKV